MRIIEERSLSSSNRPCRHNCDLKSIGDKFKNTECPKAIDCRYVSSGFDICHEKNSSRRYEWIKDYDGNIYGKSMSLKKNNICQGKITKVNSEFLWYNGYYCDYCICTCVEKPKRSDHIITAISFRDQISDIYNDRVVTGIRFVRNDRLIHLQIQEGLLLPYGKISTTRWRPLERFEFNEMEGRYYLVSERESELGRTVEYLPMRLGSDYGHAETVNLDDVKAPDYHVVTGVRCRFTWDSIWSPKRKRGPIEMQIRVTKLDFVEGRLLNHNNSWWITPDYKTLRGELVLENPDDPRNAPEEGGSVMTATSVRFRASDWRKDAGQSTVPFFDGRDTSFTPAAPLQGLGLFHLWHKGSGGYLAFRIFDFDMSPLFNSQFADSNS
ncbi:uncharacterized protein LOC130674794 [Microplitis mediator]|uniref:uncharacterized protein LOC130674794 n=1 Tax=Microplitis mediator TaxID=375433 RepID=UPI002557B806|nr:uncharacterized protein LOC130674794 [Microplitis mediator]